MRLLAFLSLFALATALSKPDPWASYCRALIDNLATEDIEAFAQAMSPAMIAVCSSEANVNISTEDMVNFVRKGLRPHDWSITYEGCVSLRPYALIIVDACMRTKTSRNLRKRGTRPDRS